MKSFYVFESEDGKFSRRAEFEQVGSVIKAQQEVLAYEESQKDPLAKLMLPWHYKGFTRNSNGRVWNQGSPDISPIMADTMNLLPLLRELRDDLQRSAPDWRTYDWSHSQSKLEINLLLAYEEIEKKAKEL